MRINLKKYGWVNAPEENFSDDGNYFYVYRNDLYPEMRVSKLVADGDVYLCAGIDKEQLLTYQEYSALPHVGVCNRLNGVPSADITEQDLTDWARDLTLFYNEYFEKAKTLDAPDRSKLEAWYREEKVVVLASAAKVEKLLATKLPLVLRHGSQDDIKYRVKWIIDYAKIVLHEAEYFDENLERQIDFYLKNRSAYITKISDQHKESWYVAQIETELDKCLSGKC